MVTLVKSPWVVAVYNLVEKTKDDEIKILPVK